MLSSSRSSSMLIIVQVFVQIIFAKVVFDVVQIVSAVATGGTGT